ncbi:hypothetical protein [Leucobacter tardus]|uniref:Uncharacterized protein n=1 Tax=Leucobacter tardus TaxID=501483 RepID=A0A939QK59_9MICO|nr:hypothetical protein [Leucobacter tardus]MBO2989214.1 hypothetical protein [Leucobacter tardus]
MNDPNTQMQEPQQVPTAKPHEGDQHRLSPFLKVSIILLAALTIASISLLFLGDFEGRFERVFSTFALFTVFVLFTAFDTSRERKSEWYAPVALIANTYILGLLLIVIWMTSYDPFTLGFEIFWKSVVVIGVTRLVILCCQILLSLGAHFPPVVPRFGFITSILAVLSGIMFTAPVGIESFDLTVPDLYWKLATATLILTALGLAITLLLRWTYGADRRAAARAEREAAVARRAPQLPGHPPQQGQPYGPGAGQPQARSDRHAPAPQQPAAPRPQVHDEQQLLPWPTYPDGRPLPMRPDGQPDFSALQHPGGPGRP